MLHLAWLLRLTFLPLLLDAPGCYASRFFRCTRDTPAAHPAHLSAEHLLWYLDAPGYYANETARYLTYDNVQVATSYLLPHFLSSLLVFPFISPTKRLATSPMTTCRSPRLFFSSDSLLIFSSCLPHFLSSLFFFLFFCLTSYLLFFCFLSFRGGIPPYTLHPTP